MHQRNPRQEEDTTTDPEKQQIESDNENNNRKDFEPLPPDSAGFKDRIVSISKLMMEERKIYRFIQKDLGPNKYSQFHHSTGTLHMALVRNHNVHRITLRSPLQHPQQIPRPHRHRHHILHFEFIFIWSFHDCYGTSSFLVSEEVPQFSASSC